MAHYAFLDENNIVTEVIVGRNENEIVDGVSDWEQHYGTFREQVCKRTSYNTYIDDAGVSQHRADSTPFRGCYAGIGYTYDEVNDVFIPQGYTYDAVNDVFVAPTTEATE